MIKETLSAAALLTATLLIGGCHTSADTQSAGGNQRVYGATNTQQSSTHENYSYQSQSSSGQTAGYQSQSGEMNLRAQGNYGNMPIRAQVNSSTGDLRVINNTDRDITNINVTANDNYTAHIDRLPANGSMVLTRNDFQGGNGALSQGTDFARNISIRANGQTWNFQNTQNWSH